MSAPPRAAGPPHSRGGSTLTLVHADLGIAVSCDDVAPLRWLAEFLDPWLAVGATPPTRRVTLALDARRHAAIVRRAVARGHGRSEVACFVADTRIVRHPVVIADGRRWIRDDELEVLYAPSARGREMEIVAPRDDAGARVALMRVVREWWMLAMRGTGSTLLHAAAARRGGHGLAVAGPKGAGKTTSLLHLLRAPGAAFVTNDRLAVRPDADGRWAGTGIPTIVSLRSGSIALLPGLAERLRVVRSGFHRTAADAGPDGDDVPPGASDRDLSPRQLSEILGVERRATTPLDAVLLPSVEPGTTGVTIERVDPRTAVGMLLASRLAAALTDPSPEALIDDDLPPSSPARSIHGPDTVIALEHLAEAVPCFRLRLGVDALAADETALAVWERVASSGRP